MSHPGASITVDIPKNHPGLPRLVEAAKHLPSVSFTNQCGVTVSKSQLQLPGVFREFFDALGDVVGLEAADEILSAIGADKRLMAADPYDLLALGQQLLQVFPLGGLAELMRRS